MTTNPFTKFGRDDLNHSHNKPLSPFASLQVSPLSRLPLRLRSRRKRKSPRKRRQAPPRLRVLVAVLHPVALVPAQAAAHAEERRSSRVILISEGRTVFQGTPKELDAGKGLINAAKKFAESTEFQRTYGKLSNGDFIDLVYLNVLERTPDFCRSLAERIGPATSEVVGQLLADRPLDRLRSVQGILGLVETVGRTRLEAACQRALAFGDPRYRRIKEILNAELDEAPLPETVAGAAPPGDPSESSTASTTRTSTINLFNP